MYIELSVHGFYRLRTLTPQTPTLQSFKIMQKDVLAISETRWCITEERSDRGRALLSVVGSQARLYLPGLAQPVVLGTVAK